MSTGAPVSWARVDDPWQEPGLPPEEGHLDSAGPVGVQRRRVAGDRHHLIGAKRGRGLHRDLDPARPRLDVRPLPVAQHAPGVDEVPEPPLDGRDGRWCTSSCQRPMVVTGKPLACSSEKALS